MLGGTPSLACWYFGSCEVHMGYSTTGSAEVVVFVGTDGTVEWDRDASAGGSLWIAFLRATSEFTGRASLAALTLVIRRGGLALQPLMKQWLNQLCMVIEGAIASHCQPPPAVDGNSVHGGGKAQLKRLGKFSKSVREAMPSQEFMLLKYYWATRQIFNDLQFVSYATDFSRISHGGRLPLASSARRRTTPHGVRRRSFVYAPRSPTQTIGQSNSLV